jgi:RES domain-containing protein
VTVWRLSRIIYQDLSGMGGLHFRGRWNEAELPIVYTSSSQSLSVLERRVHSIRQPEDDVSIQIELPDDAIEHLPPLPAGWEEDFQITRSIGMSWLRSVRSLSLRVPSAIVDEYNYLINPKHSGIEDVRIVSVTPFHYDQRLFAK